MKGFKLRYSLIPACITFGPLLMTNIGGSLDAGITSTVIALGGACIVAAGLSMMLGIIISQQKAIDALVSQHGQESNLTVHHPNRR